MKKYLIFLISHNIILIWMSLGMMRNSLRNRFIKIFMGNVLTHNRNFMLELLILNNLRYMATYLIDLLTKLINSIIETNKISLLLINLRKNSSLAIIIDSLSLKIFVIALRSAISHHYKNKILFHSCQETPKISRKKFQNANPR